MSDDLAWTWLVLAALGGTGLLMWLSDRALNEAHRLNVETKAFIGEATAFAIEGKDAYAAAHVCLDANDKRCRDLAEALALADYGATQEAIAVARGAGIQLSVVAGSRS